MPTRPVLVVAALIGAVTLAAGPLGGAPGAAAQTWAPASSATIRPGVQTFTDGAQCTANFVFSDGTNVFIGQAAHCSGTGGNTATNGCTSGSLPTGTKVTVTGASKPATMVYNSWVTMQAKGETNPDACAYNDLALLQLDPADAGKVNPSIPAFGGPVGINTTGTRVGDKVYSYGNSSLRFGVSQLSPKTGVSVGDSGNGWTHTVYTVTPGIPGDSGSAFLDANGRALGVLSTLALAPLAASNNVSDIGRMLDYLRANSPFTGVQLVDGTEPFTPSLAGLVPVG